MRVILLDDVAKVGRRGEVREVSKGYARNYLIPKKLALSATAGNLKNLGQIKTQQDAKAGRIKSVAEALRDQIEALAYEVRRQASEEGKLFGSVTSQDIVEFLEQHTIKVERRRVGLDEPILRLFDRGEPVDLITLSEELRRAEQLEFVGGPAALALLVEQASIAAHLIAYAQIVRDMGTLRELIQTSTQLITEAFEAKQDVQTLIDDAERKIFALAGRPSMGKTAFALSIAQYVGIQLRRKVLLLSLEMSAQQLVQRMLSSEGKVDSLAVRTGKLVASDWHRLTAAAGRLTEAPIFI